MESVPTLESTQSTPSFLVMDPRTLALLSFFTVGIYDLYWFFKQWQAVQKTMTQKINPLARTIFSILYCYKLFSYITDSAKKTRGVASWWAVVYIVPVFISQGIDKVLEQLYMNYTEYVLWGIGSFAMVQVTVYALYHAQKEINQTVGGTIPQKKYFAGEIVLIILGVLVFIANAVLIFVR